MFVWMTVLIFMIPWILLVISLIEFKSGKKRRFGWKLPASMIALLVVSGVFIQIYLQQVYGFPLLQNKTETIIALAVSLSVPVFLLLANLIIRIFHGNNVPVTVHNPKLVNRMAIGFFAALFAVLFIGAPTGKKLDFAYSIDQAMESADQSDAEFPVVLVSSERECLQTTATCRNSDYSNQFFIRNQLNRTQEVQVKFRVYNKNEELVKEIDSKIMKMNPNELRLIETEETIENASKWNQYTFQTENRVSKYEHFIRYRDPISE